MDFLGARIQLNPRPVQQFAAALEVAMLGHCPGRVRLERLLKFSDALAEMRQAGFGSRVDAITREAASEELYHLPIPLHSLAEFGDVFPDARSHATQYRSVLAGDQAWLAQAVEDFFANGGKKLWIVRIPESEGARGFMPARTPPLYDVDNLRGLAAVLILNNVGLVALPDLERLQVPAQLPDIPRKRLPNPDPQFLPCAASPGDDHRERRYSSEVPSQPAPLPVISALREVLALIGKHRPDMQALYTLPLSYSNSLDSPAIDSSALADLEEARGQSGAALLRQVQLLFPYLRSTRYKLRSPAGLFAGLAAASAQRHGAWRSVAGTPATTDGRPFPALHMQQMIALRESPGIGIFYHRGGKVILDDERIAVPALHRDDYSPGTYDERLNSMRSGEVVRFIGFLVRQLRALGERLIFNVAINDPRPRLVLEKFFLDLYGKGALRGALPEQAFSIRQRKGQEAVIAFDIEIAPAFPIDKIILTFANRNGQWLPEVTGG